jgi:ATP-dependent helicase/DNAse subunit B
MDKAESSKDKYKAVWLSHSSISNFLKCPRLYYLHDVYKDPKTGHKINITNPHMALGLAVHEVIDSLIGVPGEERFSSSLTDKFEEVWKNYSGKLGGFSSIEQENEFKQRGINMLAKLQKNPRILLNKAIEIKSDFVPNYWFSEKDEIILCGKVDWIEYLEDSNTVHIIDFKTGKNSEDESSLQLPIYYLLASNTQKRKVSKASYWYLDNDGDIQEKQLPEEKKAYDEIFKIASRIKLARQLNHFKCELNGCRHCLPYEKLLKGEGEKVGVSTTRQDVYILI